MGFGYSVHRTKHFATVTRELLYDGIAAIKIVGVAKAFMDPETRCNIHLAGHATIEPEVHGQSLIDCYAIYAVYHRK